MKYGRCYRACVIATYVALALYMTMSPSLLTAMGVPYIMPTGNFFFKLHPGTYMVFAAVVLGMLCRGNPLASVIISSREHLLIVLYLLGILLLFGYSMARYGPSGSAFLIETFLAPGLAALTQANFVASDRRLIYRFIIGLLVVNSLIAIIEATLRQHLIPYTIADDVAVTESFFRSTALLGHPLANAVITASLLFSTLDLRSGLFKVLLIGLFGLSLLVYGGRAASILATSILSSYLLLSAFCGLFTGRFRYWQILGGALITFVLLGLFAAIIAISGFGDSIFSRLYLDDSAAVRMNNWQVFNLMTPGELLFGLSPQDVAQVMIRLGLHYPFETIENPWIYMSMQYGLFGLATLLLALGSAIAWLYRRTNTGGQLALLVFFAAASTFNSLASKGCTLTLLFSALTGLSGFAAKHRGRALRSPSYKAQRDRATLELGA